VRVMGWADQHVARLARGETVSWTGTLKDGVLEATAIEKSASGEATYTFRGQAKQ